jgi:hypothetical protein
MARPQDDAAAWAAELSYHLGPELAADVAKEAAKILKEALQPKPRDDYVELEVPDA